MSRRGLPAGLQMRHDSHYVEELAGQQPTPIGRLIETNKLDPNPEQPRSEIGDLTDLTASICEKGVLEPLLVKPLVSAGRWLIIAGERRWRAARAAGLSEVPCIELSVDDQAVAAIALIENLQRKDLTALEEADGLYALCERFGYTHEDVARKVGKSRSSVTESLSIAALPHAIREQCRRADITSKSLLLQIVRQSDSRAMQTMIEDVTLHGLTRDGARAARRQARQPGETALADSSRSRVASRASTLISEVFRYEAPDKAFSVHVSFQRADVTNAEVAAALRAAAAVLLAENRVSREGTHKDEGQ